MINRVKSWGIMGKYKNNNKQIYIFSASLLIIDVLYWIIMFLSRFSNISTYFLTDLTNTSMDFFNIIAKVVGDSPYEVYNSNYPALVWVIAKIIHHILPNHPNANDGYFLRNYMPAQLIYILYMMIAFLLFCGLFNKYMEQKGISCNKNNLLLAFIFSGPFIFMIERGNFIFLAFLLVLAYLVSYNSESFSVRLLSYLFLGIAASIKLYPAVFGLLIIKKKRYKEAVIAVLIGVVLFIVPFMFFNGFSDFIIMIKGIFLSGAKAEAYGTNMNYSLKNFVDIVNIILGDSFNLPILMRLLLGVVIPLVGFFCTTSEWIGLFFLSLISIWTPTFSYTYSLIFFIPVVISFLSEKSCDNQVLKVLYIVSLIEFAVIFCPLPFGLIQKETDLRYPLSYNTLIVNICFVMLFLQNIYIVIIENRQKIQKKE